MKKLLIAILFLCLIAVSVYAHTIELTGIIRDFSDTHPDFEGPITGLQTGCIQNTIVNGGNPVASSLSGNCAISNLDDWYSDYHPACFVKMHSITLNNNQLNPGGTYQFQDNDFFPIDGELNGNEGRVHNYHFTFEVRFMFAYQAGQTIAIQGDDDIWVFVNNQLVIDLGGTHATAGAQVALQDLASTLGLVSGEVYPLTLFFAERHTASSSLAIQLGNIIPFSAGTEAGLTKMLAMNEQTCLLLGVACEPLNERTVSMWANVEMSRGTGVDNLLESWVIGYRRFGNTPSDNSNLVQALHNNVKSTCMHILEHPKVATFSRLLKPKAITFCESGIYDRMEQMLWPGWFSQSSEASWFNQPLPFFKANFDLGNLIKTYGGYNLPPRCPWDFPC